MKHKRTAKRLPRRKWPAGWRAASGRKPRVSKTAKLQERIRFLENVVDQHERKRYVKYVNVLAQHENLVLVTDETGFACVVDLAGFHANLVTR